MTDDVADTVALRDLCHALDAVPGPMREAFAARLRELERASVSPTPWPDDRRWWAAWYDQLVALLHLALDDPRAVAQAAALVRWGVASGIPESRQRLALEALAWACRDVAPEHTPPAALAAIAARGALIARVGRRLDTPPSRLHHEPTEESRG